MMRKTMITAYLASLILLVFSHAILPADVAIHFNSHGHADGWAPKIVNSILFGGTLTFIFVLFLAIPKLLVTLPPSLVNLPNKEYWLNEENRDRATAIFATLMYEFGTAILVYFAVIIALTTEANRATPVVLDNTLFIGSLVVFLVYTLWWSIRIITAFKVPKKSS